MVKGDVFCYRLSRDARMQSSLAFVVVVGFGGAGVNTTSRRLLGGSAGGCGFGGGAGSEGLSCCSTSDRSHLLGRWPGFEVVSRKARVVGLSM